MNKCEALFCSELNIKPVIGVIPNNKDSELLSYPKNDNFLENCSKIGKLKAGKFLCMDIIIFMIKKLIRMIFSNKGKSEIFRSLSRKSIVKKLKGLEIFFNKKKN